MYTFKVLIREQSLIATYNKDLPHNLPPLDLIEGSFEDADLVERCTFGVDLVINAADSDNTILRDALLRGFKKRFESGKGVGSLIHTSGVAIFWDGLLEGRYNPEARLWTVSADTLSFNIYLLTPSLTGRRSGCTCAQGDSSPWTRRPSVSTFADSKSRLINNDLF